MNIEISALSPTNETFEFIETHAENARQAIRQTFFKMGKTLQKKTSDAILDKSTKTGRVYIRRDKAGRKRRHRASAPGETHANRSGNLRKSIGWKVSGTESMEIGYGVTRWHGDAKEYAEIEVGFGNEQKARPSLKNNIDDARFETYFDAEMAKL